MGGFFGRIVLEDTFLEDFLGRNFQGIDLFVKILVFVKILYLRKGRKEKI